MTIKFHTWMKWHSVSGQIWCTDKELLMTKLENLELIYNSNPIRQSHVTDKSIFKIQQWTKLSKKYRLKNFIVYHTIKPNLNLEEAMIWVRYIWYILIFKNVIQRNASATVMKKSIPCFLEVILMHIFLFSTWTHH